MIDRSRKGFVLVMTLVMTFVASVVLAAVIGYVSFAARAARLALARDRCRLVAQTVIEQAKCDIQDGFDDYISENFATVRIAPNKAPAYNWFNYIGSDHRTVGSPSPVTLFAGKTMPFEIEFENSTDSDRDPHRYRVWVGVGDIDHDTDSAKAVVSIYATVEWEGSVGLKTSVTLREGVYFGTGQSRVFDNAYFVNNYGWMSGNFTINGEFRANGNVSLKNGAVVNGFIYAAANDYIGAAGTVTVSSSSIYNQSKYRSSSSTSTRSRYDTGNLDELGSYSAAYQSGTISKATWSDAQQKYVSGSRTVDETRAIVNEQADPVEMPFVSDLQSYIDYARDFADGRGGTLSYPSSTYTDELGDTRGTAAGSFTAHYTGVGPSGDASLADKGSLLLVGTAANPITISGPVVVDGDVIIKGYVTGQGTIYAGRNIHVIGDIKYVNAPTWTHSKTGTDASDEQASNETKDMLGLVAKGNIVIGDATSSSICDTVSGVSESYECDSTDATIGYASVFDGDYSAVEATGDKLKIVTSKTATGTHTEEYTVYNNWTRKYETRTRTVTDYETVIGNSATRRYWQTCCDDNAISDNRTTVSQIDAVMYNNHAVFGTLGSNFKINGALVCRDEGLSANGGVFNWDMRLRRKRNSAVVENMGLPVGAAEPYTVHWTETPDSENPAYAAAEDEED